MNDANQLEEHPNDSARGSSASLSDAFDSDILQSDVSSLGSDSNQSQSIDTDGSERPKEVASGMLDGKPKVEDVPKTKRKKEKLEKEEKLPKEEKQKQKRISKKGEKEEKAQKLEKQQEDNEEQGKTKETEEIDKKGEKRKKLKSEEKKMSGKNQWQTTIEKKSIDKKTIKKKSVVKKPKEAKPIEEEPTEAKPIEEKPLEKKPLQKQPAEKRTIEKKTIEKKTIEKKTIEKKTVEKKTVEKKTIKKKATAEKVIDPVAIEPQSTEPKPLEKPWETMTPKEKKMQRARERRARRKLIRDRRATPAPVVAFQRLSESSLRTNRSKRSSISRTSKIRSTLELAESRARLRSGLRLAKKHGTKQKVKPVLKPVDIISDRSPETSDGWEEQESIHVENTELYIRQKMLDKLREIPDINDLSDTSWHSIADKPPQEDVIAVDGTKGHFVRSVSTYYEPSVDDEYVRTGPDVAEVATSTSQISSSSASIEISSTQLTSLDKSDHASFVGPSVFRLPKDESETILQEMFGNQIAGSQLDIAYYDETIELHMEMVAGICEVFLDDIICRVVNRAEEPNRRLLFLLDKEKMLKRLAPLLIDYEDERLLRDYLDKQVTEYFFRKRRFIYIKEEIEIDILNYKRFRSAITELDRLLERRKEVTEKSQALTGALREEVKVQYAYCEQKVYDFEQFVRGTLMVNEGFTHLEGMIIKVFSTMNNIRNELSEMRLDLFGMQHRFAEIKNRSEALEDLGNGLKVREYLTQQAQVQLLSEKISDRNTELERFHQLVNYDVHALAHIKCKHRMNLKTLARMKAKLKAKEEIKWFYRDLIYKGKLKHNNMIREFNKIRSSGSLIHFPTLMIDYDETLDEIAVKRTQVEKLRMLHKSLLQRIHKAEKLTASIHSRTFKNLSSSSSSLTATLASDLHVTSLSAN
ncbi:hypothetical protein KR222_004461 [Zaprionus bogoriensis]|nr:hypothetical protein KR222_004461 [Zaprionus bogoriensis]